MMKPRIHASQLFGPVLACVLVLVFLQACDPLAIYQSPRRISPPIFRSPRASAPLAKPTETERAVVTGDKVRERALEEGPASRLDPLGFTAIRCLCREFARLRRDLAGAKGR